MHIAVLGRRTDISIAELEAVFGSDNVNWFSGDTALIEHEAVDVNRLGGSPKIGKVITHLPRSDWRKVASEVVRLYSDTWKQAEGKITLGISVYGSDAIPPRDVQKVGITIKQNLKKSGVSLRLIPNTAAQLNTATSHHNKLGLSLNKVELFIVRGTDGSYIIAESTGAQNITALARRDQGRPKRDAFVGMLPPKLALTMVNLAAGSLTTTTPRLLDPFCGTGVVLQEATLLGYHVYGTDLSEKMIRYSRDNINWLETSHHIKTDWYLHEGDAMTTSWQSPIDLVVSETYLGQPFSAPPSPKKLEEVRGNVNHITTTFLKNIRSQLTPGTPLCLAVPAWRDASGRITHLPFIHSIENLGFKQMAFRNVRTGNLIYYREDQVVARELLVLVAT